MKFAQIALGLVAATAVLADTVPLSGDCKKAFADFEECGNTEAAKMEDFVKTYQSEKCQNLYKDPIAALAKCNDLDAETKDKLIADVKFSQAYNVLYTAKTEDGKACPLYRNNSVDKVKDTCASKACTSASLEAYKLLVDGKKLNKNDVTVYEQVLKGLQDCEKNAGNSVVDAASNAANATANAVADAANTAVNATANAAQTAVNATTNAVQNAANATATTVQNAANSGATALKFTAAFVIAAVYALF